MLEGFPGAVLHFANFGPPDAKTRKSAGNNGAVHVGPSHPAHPSAQPSALQAQFLTKCLHFWRLVFWRVKILAF